MKLREIFYTAIPAELEDIEITGLTSDSRKVKPGYLFAALQGVAAHGRDYVAQAIANGATVIMSAGDLHEEPSVTHVVIRDDDMRAAFAWSAAEFYKRKPATIVAVTGTNGKSSTVDFLRQIWTHMGKRAASMGTLGAIGPNGVIDLGHTTPDPVAVHATLQQLADEGVTHVAMEASSHGLVQHRLGGIVLQAAAFTNLTQDHLDYHQTMEEYRAAKLRLWDYLTIEHRASAIINVDSPEAPTFIAEAEKQGRIIIECGWRATSPLGLKIVEIQPRPNAQTMTLKWRHEEYQVELPLIGEFQALNAVCAAALALSLDNNPQAVFAAMETLKPVKGRIEHVGATKAGAHVFVDYAHTPDGLDVLLRAARPHAPGRVIVVFGCGGDRDRGKRPKMGAIAAKQADVVIVTDDNPRSEDPAAIRREVIAGAPNAIEIGDRGEAIRQAVAMLKAGDALLIAGKGHETGQIIKGEVIPFSDQDVARAALEQA